MVIDEKTYSSALMRYRLGKLMIWLGVLVWVPFIILRVMGEQPSMSVYLPLHLLGVIGGSRLRAVARKELRISSHKRSRVQILGLGLVWVGILVWVPYFYLKLMSRPVDVMDYLPYHLISMLGGIVILVISHFLARNGEAEVQDPVG